MKSVSEFSPSNKHRDGLFPWCRPCKAVYQKDYINGVPREERRRRYAVWKAERDSDKEARDEFLRKSSAYSLKKRYGITLHQVVELAAHQGGVCAVCGALPDVTKKRGGLHVDHDHDTGKVRGLLCERCNLGLGFFRDDMVRLVSAVGYLENPPAGQVKFTEPLSRPSLLAGERNPAKRELLNLSCKHCGKTFRRRAKDEFSSRSKGKEGPFCNQKCSGTWAQSKQKIRGLIHGTTNGYTSYKCQCQKCKKAHADAERERLERKRKR